jgi:hypothetical protein
VHHPVPKAISPALQPSRVNTLDNPVTNLSSQLPFNMSNKAMSQEASMKTPH